MLEGGEIVSAATTTLPAASSLLADAEPPARGMAFWELGVWLGVPAPASNANTNGTLPGGGLNSQKRMHPLAGLLPFKCKRSKAKHTIRCGGRAIHLLTCLAGKLTCLPC